MQTKLNILAGLVGIIAGLCVLTNQNILLSIVAFIIAAGIGLAAYMSKDKKDKLVEEIHSEITNNKRSKPTETSTSIIETYMSTAYQYEADLYTKDLIALNRQLASQRVSGSSSAVVKIKELKLTHIRKYVTECLEYIAMTTNAFILDKTSARSLFANYQATDISNITTTISKQYSARGLSTNQSVISSAKIDIDNIYNVALMKIEAMSSSPNAANIPAKGEPPKSIKQKEWYQRPVGIICLGGDNYRPCHTSY